MPRQDEPQPKELLQLLLGKVNLFVLFWQHIPVNIIVIFPYNILSCSDLSRKESPPFQRFAGVPVCRGEHRLAEKTLCCGSILNNITTYYPSTSCYLEQASRNKPISLFAGDKALSVTRSTSNFLRTSIQIEIKRIFPRNKTIELWETHSIAISLIMKHQRLLGMIPGLDSERNSREAI